MHNCKETREKLIEMALDDETQQNQNQSLPAEAERCAACREEYASLRNLLRVADQAMQSAAPAETFWPVYHDRLRNRLESLSKAHVSPTSSMPSLRTLVRKLFTGSVRVPVPVAAVLIVLFGLSAAFAVHSRRLTAREYSPTVVPTTVEVPVPRERIVTRVVYRERTARGRAAGKQADAIARRPVAPSAEAPASLVGFKPANDVKLTIIKGSYRDEK